jgi:vacuolar-type H+-ATPase catalytic subunit A/Vma1
MPPDSATEHARVIAANSAGIAEIRLPEGTAPAIYGMVRFPVEIGGKALQLLGEITEIDGEIAIVQLYEGAEALAAGAMAIPTGEPSICRVAPGMPGIRMSGLGSSLDSMPGRHIPRGEQYSPLEDLRAEFEAAAQPGQMLGAGQLLGHAHAGGTTYRINVPHDPWNRPARVEWLAAPGEYGVADTVAQLRYDDGLPFEVSMISTHPVRQPRPVLRHLRATRPLFTGKRAIDASMLLLEGGKFIVIGGAGTGKTWFTQDLAKFSDVDLVVLVLCGERSGEATEVVINYQKMGLMDRTVVILNTSAQSAQARGQSVRFGLAVSEGLRDMGLNVLMIVDSLSRQGQGDRETSGMLGKMPGRQSFPVDMPSVMASTFERCGRATCLGGFDASITGVMAVSPDGDDYEGDAIAQVARQYADGTVILTNKVAHRGYYPAVGFGAGLSTSKTTGRERREQLEAYFRSHELEDWIELGEDIAATVAESEGPLTDQIKVLTAKRMSAEDYRRYLLGAVYRRAFFTQDSGHAIDQRSEPQRILTMMRFCRRVAEVFPLLQDKDEARRLADQLGGRAFPITQMDEGYEAAYDELIEWLRDYRHQHDGERADAAV